MRIFQSLSLIVALAVCYLWFFHSQAVPQSTAKDTDAVTALTPEVQSVAVPKAKPQTQYKAQLDQARNVASQMKAARQQEADSF